MTHSQPPAEPSPPGAPVPPPGAPLPPPPAASPYAVEQVEVKVPPVAWLVPLAALLAVVGAFIPWFAPEATAHGNGQTAHHTFSSLYSWKDGKIGLLAPIVLVVLAIGVVGLLRGKTPRRFAKGSTHPATSAGRAVLIAGVVSAACVVIAWFMVESQYKFVDTDGTKYSWNGYISAAKAAGFDLSLSRGPQAGFFLTAAAAVVAIVTGILLLVMKPKQAPAGPATVAAPPAQPYGQPYQPPAQQYGQPYQAPAQQYGQPYQPPAQPYQPPASQYGPPAQGEQPPHQQ